MDATDVKDVLHAALRLSLEQKLHAAAQGDAGRYQDALERARLYRGVLEDLADGRVRPEDLAELTHRVKS